MEIKFNQVDVAKLNLGPDDTLVVMVKGKREEMNGLELLAQNLQQTFDQNKLVVMGIGSDDEIKFTVVKEKPQNYCSDCSCGKKESFENSLS